MTRYQLENENDQANLISIDVGLTVAKSCLANRMLDLEEEFNHRSKKIRIRNLIKYYGNHKNI